MLYIYTLKSGYNINFLAKERFFVTFKKSLSVFLACVMLLCTFSLGLTGIAASIDYNTQYNDLADALKNDYVRDLTNYTLQNLTKNDKEKSFNKDANGFVYEHRVIAKDNAAGSILKAANIFYYIAESLMSTTYGEGKYNAELLIAEVSRNLKTRFNPADDSKYYEDFYGARYYPTEEELTAYNEAVEMITAAGREPSQASLSEFRIYFIEKDYYEFYNVDTILKYFMGNTVKINAGNWYHQNTFIVETSAEAALIDNCEGEGVGINNAHSTTITTRTAVYETDYSRTFIDEGTKAVYAFKAPSITTVYENYGTEFHLEKTNANLRTDADIRAKVQASGLLVNIVPDTTTISEIQNLYSLFTQYIKAPVDGEGKAWDARFASMNEAQIAAAVPNADVLVNGFEELTSKYSNEAIMAMFGGDTGDMVTLVYILKPISQSPTRIVRDGASFTATADKLNAIVRDMDALIYDETSDTAQRVGTIVKQFFNTNNPLFEGTAVEGMDFTDLNELVHHLVTGLLFRDSIVNMLVKLIYPMVADLIAEKIVGAVANAVGNGLGDIVDDLVTNIINQNDLAIYPDDLADRIGRDYPGRFAEARAVLKAAGHSWDNVNYDAITWGVDDAPYNEKSELFIDALCAGLGGFMRVVVTVMCGNAKYSENIGLSYDDEQFDSYFDKKIINILGITVWLRAQGGYTKLIVPLFRALGIPEMANGATYNTPVYGYVTPEDYHRIIASKDSNGNYRYNYSLRLILAPIIYWIENILAERPFETIWDMIPNLVFFFTRQGISTTSLADIKSHNESDVRNADSSHGKDVPLNTPDEWEELSTYNLLTILDNILILIDTTVPVLFNKNFTTNVGSLSSLIGKNEMLSSVNGLLNEVLKLEYIVGESGILNTVAYANDAGVAVMPDSYEYATNSAAYPNALQYVYANENETEYRAAQDDVFYKEITNPEYIKAPYSIPALQEAKLTTVTTLKADGTMVNPNAIGVLNSVWNTIDVKNPGVVLMYVLRFVLSALGYKYDISESAADTSLPFLIECFGLDIDKELFQGLNLKDIIFNVMLHPDEAICALLELFYSNERGNFFNGTSYTYPVSNIDYHDEVFLDENYNPGLTYGTAVRYSKYWTREYAADTLDDLDDLATNVLKILINGEVISLDGFENGLPGFLQNLLNEKVFNNKLMNTLFNTIYQLLSGLNDSLGFDIETILDAALGIRFDTGTIGRTIEAMMGYETPASRTIKNAASWTALFDAGHTETDPVTGEETAVIADVDLDWGIDSAAQPHYAFLKSASAILAPAAFAIRFLFMDQHLDILGLIDIDSYAGYEYAFIGLLEALSCPTSPDAAAVREGLDSGYILTYEEYYQKGLADTEGNLVGDANTIYYLLYPVLGLVDQIYADPITTLFGLIPNLLFFISIGGLNDLLNNLVHFAYVLLDILKPIVNGYDLLSGLLSNINISGYILNLSLPLDVDFNAIISDLLDTLVGDSLEISGVRIKLPYIDFHTLCCGTLEAFSSKERILGTNAPVSTVHLNSAGGADLVTAIFRLVFEVIYMDENQEAVGQIIRNAIDNGKVDEFDGETLAAVLSKAFDLVEQYEVLDMALFAVYFLVTKLTPLSQTIVDKNINVVGFIKDFDINNPESIVDFIMSIIKDPDEKPAGEIEIPKATLSLWERIKAFFARISNFFKNLFKF